MDLKRREFVRQLGLFVMLLAETRCSHQGVGAAAASSTPHEAVRSCWMSLGWLSQQRGSTKPHAGPEEAPNKALIDTHRAAVAQLVARGELGAPVAELVDKAFESVANHVWWTAIKAMCYAPSMPWEFTPQSSEDLYQQLGVLEELARTRAFDDPTLERIRGAIARDIGFLSLSQAEASALMAPHTGGPQYGRAGSTFGTAVISLTPDRRAAAEFLIALILETRS